MEVSGHESAKPKKITHDEAAVAVDVVDDFAERAVGLDDGVLAAGLVARATLLGVGVNARVGVVDSPGVLVGGVAGVRRGEEAESQCNDDL